MSFLKIINVYKRLLIERPGIVQSIQTASLMTVGDVISQSIAEKKSHSQINCYRSFKFGSIGFVLGPVLSQWYRILDKIGGKNLKIAFVKRIALDQLMFAPVAIASITTLASLIDGKSKNDIMKKLKQDYFHMVLANYKVWPLVQCVNFSIVPLEHRVLVTQSVAVGWNAYLSWKINSDER